MLPETLPIVAQPVAADTWLIPTLASEPSGSYFSVNSMIIRGTEPIVVDTGALLVRDEWLDTAFALVEPDDVKWIFLSHDDHDHIGNLEPVLDRCPNATLVANYGIVGRLAGDVDLPLHRMRWVDPGEAFDAGDRTLTVMRPPLFDSPATRGLFDTRTGVLWAADTFGALFPGPVYEADDVPADLYDTSFDMLNSWNTPWLEWVDNARFGAHVETTAALPVTAVASAHGPILRGRRITDAFRRTLALAGHAPAPMPGQPDLEALVALVAAAETEVAA